MIEPNIIEIIVIGHELLDGRRIDSNSAWLGRKLTAMGFEVAFKQTVLDDVDDIIAAMQLAYSRASYVLVSGGLGPTSDDVTFAAIAQSLEQNLVHFSDVEDAIKRKFLTMDKPYAVTNRRQAMLPEKAQVLSNSLGTAPGIRFEYSSQQKNGVGFCLPGVPSEMRAIFLEHIAPEMGKVLEASGQTKQEKTFTLSGVSESAFAHKVDELFAQENKENKTVNIAYTASYPKLDVTLCAYSEKNAFEIQCVKKFYDAFADFIIAQDGKTIEQDLFEILKQQGLTISFAESCTGGLLCATMLNTPGTSAILKESLVCYSNQCKQEKLAVPSKILNTYGAVSQACARAMAQGQLFNSGADISVAATGIAGPDGGSKEKPVGLVYIALSVSESVKEKYGFNFEDKQWVRQFQFKGDRNKNRLGSVMEALKLIKELLNCLKLKS